MQGRAYFSILSEVAGLSSLILLTGIKGLILYLTFHGVASFRIASLIYLLLPKKYKSRRWDKLLFAIITLIVFLTGPLGILGGLLFYFMLLKKPNITIPVENLFFENVTIPQVEKRSFGETQIEELHDRLIFFLTKYPTPRSIQLLKRALSSEQDEVRLMAFSAISKMEKEVFERINLLIKELEKVKTPEELYRISSSLAELYWELVYLGIAEEELAEFYLRTALEYAIRALETTLKYGLRALEISKDGKLLFLIGRIYLRLKDYEKAEKFLREAVEEGIPIEKVAPYLMEIYFIRRDWKVLKKISENLRGKVIPDAKAVSIIKVWV